jgi:aminoglycoside phosphotransferase family enzyme/predicted kinase
MPHPAPVDPEALRRDLARPEAHAARPARVEVLATHISWLFLAGERVYKVKQPVDLGFLDYTTLERRRHFCEEEVRLGRRTAPGVYLGVVPITRGADGRLRVGGDGEPLEYAVEMIRLPAERMLDALLERGELDNAMLAEVRDLLVRLHAAAATGRGVDEHGAPRAVRDNAAENFEQLQPFVGAPGSGDALLTERHLALLRERQLGFLEAHDDLLRRRVTEGRIREGHGDLHAGNLCFLESGVVAYDAIEFSARFRCGDVAADLAFLAMDLDERGYPAFAAHLARGYAEAAGDGELAQLLPFYKGYRAVVRGKVAALTALGRSGEARLAEQRRAMRYLQLAAAYELPPTLLLMCGLPASGKSFLARDLARALRAVLLRSDTRRKLMAGLRPTARAGGAVGEGLYGPERKAAVYRALLDDAVRHLGAGHSVLVDATFTARAERDRFVDAAERAGLPYQLVHVTAPEDLVLERLAARARDPGAVSDADEAVYRAARASFEPPEEVPAAHRLEVESGRGPAELGSARVIERLIAGASA